MGYAISAESIKKSYKDVEVLKGINLNVEKGSILALLGPNGAGKTTFVRILTTLLMHDEGQASVNGYDIKKQSDKVRESIGLTGQNAAVDELLSGYDNLVMFGRLFHLTKEDAIQRANELLKQFDLEDARDRKVKTYSGGMRRRLDLAACLVALPPVIFLDEPTTGLDPRSRLTMWKVIEELSKEGVTILLTTQYLEEADYLADRIAVLDNGTIIAEGTADELKKRVGKDRIEFTIAKNSDFTKAKEIIKGESVQVNEEERKISVATEKDVADLRIILAGLEGANIEIDELQLHKPTLDDVFMTLTGHKTQHDTETQEDNERKEK